MPRAKQLQRARGEDEAATPLDAAFKLVDALPVPVFFKSRDGRYLGVNRAWEEFFGIPGESFIGKQVADLYPQDPAIAEKHAAMDRELYARPGRQSYEIAVRARDGKLRDAMYYKATYKDARGEVAGLIGTIIDITERKSIEAALRENEERYRRTFELAGSGLAQVGLDGRFLRVNRRLCEFLGYSEAELVGMQVKDISHPEDRDSVDERRKQLIAGDIDTVRLEKRYLRKDGATVWASIAIALERDSAGRPLYAISVLDDITARKETEERLRESEARYRSTFELAASGIAHIGLDRKFIRVNRRLCEILGYPERELIGMTGRDISHPEDLEVINTQRTRLYAGEIDHVHVEKRYLRKDGSVVWVAFSMVLERDSSARPFYEIAIFDDITERKRAEAALRESEERFRSLTQLSSDWYWEQDENFALRFMSRRMGERTGLDAAAFIGRKRWDQPALNLTDEAWARHRASLERHEPFRDFEMERPNPAGGTRWVSVTGEPVYDENGRFRGYRGVGSDVTQRKQAEAELRRAHDELASKAEELQRSNAELEQFAYVASHDLQEPLRMVSSYTQLLAKRYKDQLPSDAQEFMQFMVDGAARMKQLIEDLLAYSRVGTKGKEFVAASLEAPLKRALTNLRAAIQESGAAVTADALPTVDGDEVQLAQIFQNLIGNALKFRGAAAPHVHVGAVEEAGEWHISVADNGIGIEPQYFERIFMLFQRLHAMGEYPGTGIGLAICKKVAERHGGRIWVSSQPGAGSTFHFTLPKKEFP